jgi:hypothetical protein
MPATLANPYFFVAILRDYVLLLLFLALVAGWFFIKRLPNWIRSIRGASWPAVEGRVETVGVNAFAEQAVGEVGYSYLVEGVRYSGYFSRQFADEQDAWSYVSPLKGQSVFVRYKSDNPDTSALRPGEQSAVFKPRPGDFPKRLLSLLFENLRS